MSDEHTQRKEAEAQARAEMAACYARVFLGSDDGKRVLKSLRAKFGHEFAFVYQNGQRVDAMVAAVRDGHRQVIAEIDATLRAHDPKLWANSLF